MKQATSTLLFFFPGSVWVAKVCHGRDFFFLSNRTPLYWDVLFWLDGTEFRSSAWGRFIASTAPCHPSRASSSHSSSYSSASRLVLAVSGPWRAMAMRS